MSGMKIYCKYREGADSFGNCTYIFALEGNAEQTEKIARCNDKEVQIRVLGKYRYRLLDEIHRKQQSLDEIDYMVSKVKEQS